VKPLRLSLTIPQRLLLGTTLACSSALVIAGATLALLDERQSRKDLLGRRTTDAEIIGLHTATALLFDDPASAAATLAVLRLKSDVENACSYTRDRRLFAEYVARGTRCAVNPAFLASEYRQSGNRLVVSRPIVVRGEVAGTVVIESSLDELTQHSRRMLWSGLGVAVLALAIGLAISWRYQRTLSGPLLELARTAREISTKKDYAMRVQGTAPGEIGVLVEKFNEMLGHIEERDRELMKAQAELEQRVEVRTEELRQELGVRREAEEEVRRLNAALSQQLEEVTALNRDIESFSYSVSHDLRAPLRHVSGFVELLKERTASLLDETSRRYLGVIAKGAAQMGCLIDDLLGFSRMSRTELNQGDVCLEDLVREAKQEAERETGGREIEWVLGPLPTVTGDRAMLHVVFANLLSNAVKYSRRVARARIEVGWKPANDGLVAVFVRDNGVGFDMKYAGKLFGVFQRLHKPEEFEGTGIGLATVRRIVNRHGGDAWAESEAGRGSTFYITLVKAEGV
jgi:signal transduction histidine kinase